MGGNLFYTAQPLGVKDGIDLGSTGEVLSPMYLPYISPISPLYLPYISSTSTRRVRVHARAHARCTARARRGVITSGMCAHAQVRRVEVDKIRGHLQQGEIVLLGALGYSASGDVFNVKSEEVAS